MDKQQRKKILNNIDIVEVLNQIHAGLSICNEKGEMLYVTESYERIYGKTTEDIIGKKNGEILTTKNAISESVIAGGKKIVTKQENIYGDEMFVTGVPVYGKDKKIKYAVVYNSWEINDEDELMQKYIRLQDENSKLRTEIDFINAANHQSYNQVIAINKKMGEVIEKVKHSSEYDVSVFFSGERGCGKRYLAGYMHRLSPRSDAPLYFFNADEVYDISVEEALFGNGSQAGILHFCDRGTLVIEAVEKLNFSTQNKLAQFLKSGEYMDVIGQKRIADVKVILISSNSALELMEKKMISRNLYYQVGMVEIAVPPIRQRLEDLDQFIDLYLDHYNKKYEKKVTLGGKAKNVLLSYDWPDNIKEIRFVIEQIVLLNDDGEISAYDLPENLTESYYGNVEEIGDLKTMLEYYERKIIIETYNRCKTSVALAKELNISQASASRKIQKYVEKGSIQN